MLELPEAHRGRDPRARRALGRRRPAARAARRRDPAARPHPLPRADASRCSSAPSGCRGALAMALKRRGRWFDPALVDALLVVRDDRAFWGPLEDARAVPPVAAWEPADRVLYRRRRHARPRSRRVRPRDRREVAVHRPPLGRGGPLGRRDGRGHGRAGRRAARPAPRRPAARHRQARRLEPDPRQARQARPGRAGRDPRAPALHAADPRARRLPARHRRDRRRAPRAARRLGATTAAWPPSTSRARRASSPSPTSTRR